MSEQVFLSKELRPNLSELSKYFTNISCPQGLLWYMYKGSQLRCVAESTGMAPSGHRITTGFSMLQDYEVVVESKLTIFKGQRLLLGKDGLVLMDNDLNLFYIKYDDIIKITIERKEKHAEKL